MPLKILHVEAGTNLYGGALQVWYLLRGLHEQHHANILVCPHNSDISRRVTDITQRVYAIPMKGDADFSLIWRLRNIIREEQPDIVHLHSRRGADFLGAVAARLAHTRVVLTRRVDNPESVLLVRIKYGLCDKVVCISEGIKNVLLSEGVIPEKVVCVPSAVDSQKYNKTCDNDWFRKELGLSQHSRVIGMIAQFIERKGHRYLVQAIPRILSEYPDVQFVLFGKGPLEAGIRDRIQAAGLQSSVHFAGFRDDLECILPCLYAVVHPAEMEGLGVSLLQAAASRIPIVGTNVGGIPEIIRNKVNGYLIPARSSQAITDAVIELLRDPAKAGLMGNAGRELVETRFSITAMVTGNLNVYHSLLGQ